MREQSESEIILEIVKNLKDRPNWSQWLIPVVVSALVSLLVSTLTTSTQKQIEVAKMRWDILDKAEQINLVKARLLLEHSLEPISDKKEHEKFQQAYNDFVSGILVAADEDPPPEQKEAGVTSEQKEALKDKEIGELVDKLDTSDRYAASRKLIEKYTEKPQEVIQALIDSIDQETSNKYRQQLYIAYTLAKLPDKWEGTEDQFQAVCQLKDSPFYKQDQTFKNRVNQAITNHKDNAQCNPTTN